MRRPVDDAAPGLDLTPILNVVMILIPLLVLGVAFEQLGVLALDTSVACACHSDVDHPGPTPLRLHVHVTPRGFALFGGSERLAAAQGCPDEVTICNHGDHDVAALLAEQRDLRGRFDVSGDRGLLAASDARLARAEAAYDRRGLYNRLAQLKALYPEERQITLSADPDVPFDLVAHTIDVVQTRLASDAPDGTFASDDAFLAARPRRDAHGAPSPLFDSVRFTVAQ